jgi:hypothetical protein
MGGYFIGTCYDGKTVFKRLQHKTSGEGIAIMKNERKMYEITKMYEETGFPDDETSVNYMIHVYQDSINKIFPEYLVNFEYLVQMLSNYGFVLINKDEAIPMGLPNGTGMFSELFTAMENEIEQNPKKEVDYKKAIKMSADEKWISFMNRYFVFKKTHSVDAERIYKQFVSKQMLGDLVKQAEEIEDALELAKEKIEEPKKQKIRKVSTKGTKVVIDKYSPVVDSVEDLSPREIERIAESVAIAISSPSKLDKVPPAPGSPKVSKLVLGEKMAMKVAKPKIVIGESVKIIKKIKKADT